jgi:hypothetical protein
MELLKFIAYLVGFILFLNIISLILNFSNKKSCPTCPTCPPYPEISPLVKLDRAILTWFPTSGLTIPYSAGFNGVELANGASFQPTVLLPENPSVYKNGSYFYVVNNATSSSKIDKTRTNSTTDIPMKSNTAKIFKVNGNLFDYVGSLDSNSFRIYTLSSGVDTMNAPVVPN